MSSERRPVFRSRYTRAEYEAFIARDIPQNLTHLITQTSTTSNTRNRSAGIVSPSREEAIRILQDPEFNEIRNEILGLRETLIILYARDRAICQLCSLLCLPSTASVDHIIPRRYNGSGVVNNLQLAHRFCNNVCCIRRNCPHERYKCTKVIQFEMNRTKRPNYYFSTSLAA